MRHAACITFVLAMLLAGAAKSYAHRMGHGDNLDLLRLLSQKPWRYSGQERWDRMSGYVQDHDDQPKMSIPDEDVTNYLDDDIRVASGKRSAVATVLNGSRRRRQPTPALGKAITPFVSVGVLNDFEAFIHSLRDNMVNLASLSPEERASFYQEPPTAEQTPSTGGGGGGSGIRKLNALRPLRPTGNIRSYNRRSYLEAEGGYPASERHEKHDPKLNWISLGR